MKKQTRKWTAALLAVGCASICMGAGVVAHNYSATGVTAEADVTYTTHEIGALNLHVNSSVGAAKDLNNTLYLKRADGGAFPILSWDYSFAAENENAFKINGQPAALNAMKSTGDGMYFSFAALKAGDVITVSGTYVCESQATKYVITESSFKWNGSGWSEYVYINYTEFNVGSLQYDHGNAKQVYFKPVDSDITLPVNNWDDAFSYGSGNGITVNGTMISFVNSVKSPEGCFFADLGANAKVGDVLKIGGTLNCEKQAIAYVIEDCEFIWDGATWVKQGVESPEDPDSSEDIESSEETPIEYTIYNVGAIRAESDSNASNVYITPADGDGNSLGAGDWGNVYTFEAGSGDGLKLNDTVLTTKDIKQPGSFFIALGVTAVAGDILTIDGAYYNDTTAKKIIFENSQLQFDGSAWVTYGVEEEPEDPDSSEDIGSSEETPIEYTIYNVGAIRAESDSNASNVYITPADGDGNSLGAGDWGNVYTFEAGSGDGLKLNDTVLTTKDIKQPGSFFIALGVTAVAGDILTIDGAYYNDTTAKKIIFENSQLQFDGSAWVTYGVEEEPEDPDSSEDIGSSEETPIEYTTYTVNKLGGANNCSDTVVFAYVVDGDALMVDSWDYAFSLESGNGILLNGEPLVAWELKQPGADLYIGLAPAAVEGDILTIDGTFYNEQAAAKIVFNNCELKFNGTTWVMNVAPDAPIEYTTYEIGVLEISAPSYNGTVSTKSDNLYLRKQDGSPFPVQNWDYLFMFEEDAIFKVNGEDGILFEMKSTEHGLFLAFIPVNEGDEVTISGTFYNAALAVKYVIEESTLVWNGSIWQTYEEFHKEPVEYVEYELGEMIVDAGSSTDMGLYITRADAGELPVHNWDYRFIFVEDSGCGILYNGEFWATEDVKSPGNNMYIHLADLSLKAGDVITIGGSFCNENTGAIYVIKESSFIYDGTAWFNKIDIIKTESKAAVEEYKNNFVEENYYEAEWNSFDTIIADAKLAIDVAETEADVAAIVDAAKAAMDEVVTKEESDAIFDELKVSAQTDLDNYKSESDYRAADWAEIVAIIAAAKTEINAATSVTAINTAVNNAKTQIDAIKTAAEKDADEAAVAAAKAELADYKKESDYKAEQWTEIQAILTKANTEIDGAIGDESEIAEIVADAKAKMDAVKTATEKDADDAVVAAAKAELAADKSESDYKAEQWAEIQAILAKAGTDLDKASGNESAIAEIVATTKTALDKVMTADVAEAAALAAAKEAGKEEALSYYASINLDLYSDEAAAEISGYVAAAIAAIESATNADEINAAVAQLKTNVGGVEKIAGGDEEKKSSGCGSVVGGLAASAVLTAAAVAMLFKKKED